MRTPGPWITDPEHPDHVVTVAADGGRTLFLSVASSIAEEREANARLCAAAPELLAFAQFVLQGLASGAIKASPYMDMDPNAAALELKTVGSYAAEVIGEAEGGAA